MLNGAIGVQEQGTDGGHVGQERIFDQAHQPIGGDDFGVVVQEDQHLPARVAAANVVESGPVEGNVGGNDAYACVLGQALETGLGFWFGGAIVEHQDLVCDPGGVAMDTLDTGVQQIGLVTRGDDDAGHGARRHAEPRLVHKGVVAVIDPVKLLPISAG